MRFKTALFSSIVTIGVVVALCAAAIVGSHGIRWRAEVVFKKASGQLSDIEWSDLAWMLRPRSGVLLEELALNPSPFQVIQNPKRAASDAEAGKALFARHCSSCHGDDAQGGPGGPSLHDHTFRQGRSAWALYRTITRGVPGTAMLGWSLPRDDVWRLVAYLEAAATAQGRPSEGELAHRVEAVSPAELRAAGASDEWLTYAGSYDAHRHSRLQQISRETVGKLHVVWQRQLPEARDFVETSPIVRGATMFITEPPNRVLALDATSGRVLWSFQRELPQGLKLCCGAVNRGVAVLGANLYVGTPDAHLIALDASTGKLVWDVAVADFSSGYSITAAPLAVGDLVITGVAGGEYETRGFVDAYDAATGKRRWRFFTVPAAGEPGSETWDQASLSTAGAPSWMTGAFDPELGLIYWGIGNPHPNFFGGGRRGDNLYSNSVVALDVATGTMRWYFQFTPHDLHDWDAAQTPILVDAAGQKLMAWPNRNGFYYLLDRNNGKFLLGTPFVKQTWSYGLDGNGRPNVRPDSVPAREGTLVHPSVTGGTNWWASTYDPALGLMFVPTLEQPGIFFGSPRRTVDREGETLGSNTSRVPGERLTTAVKALEIATGRVRWQHGRAPRTHHAYTGGLLSTAGGLVFGSDMQTLFALDSATGAELWRFHAGAEVMAAPVSYQVAGRQYVAIAAGHSILAFALAP